MIQLLTLPHVDGYSILARPIEGCKDFSKAIISKFVRGSIFEQPSESLTQQDYYDVSYLSGADELDSAGITHL